MKHLTDEQISELLDGFLVLSPKQQEHLQNCTECRRKFEEFQSISWLLQKLTLETVPERVTSRIAHQISSLGQNYSTKIVPSYRWSYGFVIPSVVIALLLIIGISYVYFDYRNSNIVVKEDTPSFPQKNIIAKNNNDTNQTSNKVEMETIMEDNLLDSISEEYLRSEPFEEELHSITIAELLLSLAEETEEYNINDISL